MARVLFGAAMAIACVLVAGCERKAAVTPATKVAAPATDPNAAVMAKAKYRVTYDFHDPSTAQFRELVLYKRTDGLAVCGQVNGKNLSGGYVGFFPFAWESSDDKAWVDNGRDQITHALVTLVCNDNTKGTPADITTTTTTTTTEANDTLPTPTPAGFKQVASLAYADDKTVSEEGAMMLREATGSATVTRKTDDGTSVDLTPRLVVPLPSSGIEKQFLVVLTGTTGECHACTGAFAIAHVEQVDANYSAGVTPVAIAMGSWGQPPQIVIYQKGGQTLLRGSYTFTGQGCAEEDGQLFRVSMSELQPVAKAYTHQAGCIK